MKSIPSFYTFLFLILFCNTISFGQYGPDFNLSIGGQYIIPQKTLKEISKGGVGFEYMMSYQFPVVDFGIIHLASINEYTSHETFSWGWPGTNNPRPKKFQSFQTLNGFMYKINSVFVGGGIGYTAFIESDNDDLTSGMSQFLLIGVNPVGRLRAIGKYVIDRRKEDLFRYRRAFDNFSLSLYFDIWKIN